MSDPTHQNDFVSSGFFALRTPLLPFDELLAWSDGLEAASAGDDSARLEAAIAADHRRLRERLREIFTRPEVREALFVASPSLDERFDGWLREPHSAEENAKLQRALVRYFVRMAGRATPFGLFAGCSVGMIGARTRLTLAERACYRRHTRLDTDYLVALTDALARQPDVQSALRFGVNNSLYPTQGRLRYMEVRRDGKGWTHHQVALDATDYLQATLARAAPGAPPQTLAAGLLEDDPEASPDEAAEYIGELINSQVLVSELRPTVTGPEPLGGLVQRLRECGGRLAEPLDEARRELESLDARGLGAEPSRYRHIARLLEGLPGQPDIARLFQVDMVKPVQEASLGPAVVAEIVRGVTVLHRLARRPREDHLARFREAFVNRYEGREVPLIEALDVEAGVGFGTLTAGATDASSLLDGLTFPKANDEQSAWGRREAILLGKLGEALAQSASQIVLEPRDLDQMAEKDPPPLPDALAVMATVAATSEAALERGEFHLLWHAAVGPSGARLLGRFCHADPQLHTCVEQHMRAEESLEPNSVFAEIVHLPEGRLGNVLARPVLRAYEIPYLGRASVPAQRQIPVTDLLVSVQGEKILLRSARLGRRVVPRLTSAHNFEMSQGIYQFLCALQSQGTAGGLAWDWGPLRDAAFLPRVACGRLVLSRATWRVGEDEWKPLGQAAGAARFRLVQSWRQARRLPRWIALAEADNELPIDLDNVAAVDTLVELVKGRDQFLLVELFPGPDQLCAHGPEGRFVHELVVPFVRRGATAHQPQADAVATSGHARSFPVRAAQWHRSFPPGSEWLFAKLYSGPATTDQLLRDVVRPVVERVLSAGAADVWFFVRYGDPDWHLRLRFHGEPARLGGEVLPVLQAAAAPLLDDRRLWRIQLDTYEREVERYGGAEGMVLAERLFQADSEAVLALADLFSEDARGDLRWRLSLFGMDLLLGDLGFDLEARHTIVHRTREMFAAEFHAEPEFARQLAAKFRPERRGLEAMFDPAGISDAQLAAGFEILRRRSQSLAPVMAELSAGAREGRLSMPLANLAPSYLHMHANRLLRSAHRAQELVLYDFLARLYQSWAARDQCPHAASSRAETDRPSEALPPTK